MDSSPVSKEFLEWTQVRSTLIILQFISGIKNTWTDQLSSKGKILPVKWTLPPLFVKFKLWG